MTKITVGPVVGKVTYHSIRVMLEIDKKANLCCFCREFLNPLRQKTITGIPFQANRPKAFTIKGLDPSTEYEIRFGMDIDDDDDDDDNADNNGKKEDTNVLGSNKQASGSGGDANNGNANNNDSGGGGGGGSGGDEISCPVNPGKKNPITQFNRNLKAKQAATTSSGTNRKIKPRSVLENADECVARVQTLKTNIELSDSSYHLLPNGVNKTPEGSSPSPKDQEQEIFWNIRIACMSLHFPQELMKKVGKNAQKNSNANHNMHEKSQDLYDAICDKVLSSNVKRLEVVLHLGTQILGNDSHKKCLEILKEASSQPDTDDNTDELNDRIAEVYRNCYRKAYNHPSLKKILARCSNMMILDEKDIYNGFGTSPKDFRPDTREFRVASIALMVYREYQRQLWDEQIDQYIKSHDCSPAHEAHFHVFDHVGIIFVDQFAARLYQHHQKKVEKKEQAIEKVEKVNLDSIEQNFTQKSEDDVNAPLNQENETKETEQETPLSKSTHTINQSSAIVDTVVRYGEDNLDDDDDDDDDEDEEDENISLEELNRSIDNADCTYLTKEQWKDIEKHLRRKLKKVRALIVATSSPIAFFNDENSSFGLALKQSDEWKNIWAYGEHSREQVRLLHWLEQWKKEKSDIRNVHIVSGSIGFGCHTSIMKNSKLLFEQLITSPVVAPPVSSTMHLQYLKSKWLGYDILQKNENKEFKLNAFRKHKDDETIEEKLNDEAFPKYSVSHRDFTLDNNFGIIDVTLGVGKKPNFAKYLIHPGSQRAKYGGNILGDETKNCCTIS